MKIIKGKCEIKLTGSYLEILFLRWLLTALNSGWEIIEPKIGKTHSEAAT
jgi:hypothetical protein